MKQLGLALAIILTATVAIIYTNLPAQTKKAQYIGSAKCKMCHKTAKQGEQFPKWEAGPHAKAYATLATDAAKEVAKKAGVQGDPQKAADCLVCHATGHDAAADAKAASFKVTEGVGCEACHGPGSLYKSMKVMKAIAAGTQDAKAVSYMKGGKEKCLECHNEKSPTYKPFNHEERWAEIAHPKP